MPKRPSHIIGPSGKLLNIDALPSNNTVRWTARRKAEVVSAVRGGLLTPAEVCARYRLATEELDAWQSAVERGGCANEKGCEG